MSSIKFSIIVPVHNSEDTLNECLKAIISSEYKDHELIVIDDCSNDGSVEIAKRFQCQVVRLNSNMGAAAARNRGAQETKNPIIIFVDSDIVLKQNSLSKIAAIFSKHNEVAGVSGIYSIHNRFNNFLSQYKHLVVYYRDTKCQDICDDSFKASFLAIKRDIFLRYKFDESYKRASIEDIELGRQLVSLGYKFILDKSNEVEHIKKITVKTFVKNQYDRSKDIAKSWAMRSAYKFYLSDKRENRYAKLYIARVPLGWILIFTLLLFFITMNYIFLSIAFLPLLISIAIEKDFLNFCFKKRGLLFMGQCVFIYFVDGFVSGLGVIKGVLEIILGKHR